MKQSDNNIKNTNTLAMIQLYFGEWKYRHAHYWSTFIKLSVISYAVILMPYIYEVFISDLEKINLPLYVFPILGFLISIAFFLINLAESARLTSVNITIDGLIMQLNPSFARIKFDDIKDLKFKKLIKLRISYILTWGNLVGQLLLAILIFILVRR